MKRKFILLAIVVVVILIAVGLFVRGNDSNRANTAKEKITVIEDGSIDKIEDHEYVSY